MTLGGEGGEAPEAGPGVRRRRRGILSALPFAPDESPPRRARNSRESENHERSAGPQERAFLPRPPARGGWAYPRARGRLSPPGAGRNTRSAKARNGTRALARGGLFCAEGGKGLLGGLPPVRRGSRARSASRAMRSGLPPGGEDHVRPTPPRLRTWAQGRALRAPRAARSSRAMPKAGQARPHAASPRAGFLPRPRLFRRAPQKW